jgi:hypothetical protein
VRNAARRRRDAFGGPKVQRFPQRALYRRRIERIAELLTAALGGSVADTVLVAGDQIEARHRIWMGANHPCLSKISAELITPR